MCCVVLAILTTANPDIPSHRLISLQSNQALIWRPKQLPVPHSRCPCWRAQALSRPGGLPVDPVATSVSRSTADSLVQARSSTNIPTTPANSPALHFPLSTPPGLYIAFPVPNLPACLSARVHAHCATTGSTEIKDVTRHMG